MECDCFVNDKNRDSRLPGKRFYDIAFCSNAELVDVETGDCACSCNCHDEKGVE